MKTHLLCLVVTLAVASPVEAGQSGPRLGWLSNPPDLAHLSYEKGSEAVTLQLHDIADGLKGMGPAYITNLVNQIRRGGLDKERIVLAIYLLGELRPDDTNSIESLIEMVDLKASRFDPPTRPIRWGPYPACEALIKIGKPAANPIYRHLLAETHDLRRDLMCQVLKRVEGNESARSRISAMLTLETDVAKRANLTSALEQLDK
jgi:hypothetical protein